MSSTDRSHSNLSRKLTVALAAAAAAARTFGARGGNDTATSSDSAASADSTKFNDADVLFAQSMIPHHEQVIEMTEIALDPAVGAGPEVIDIAERIQAAQDPEIKTMKAWLVQWKKPTQMDANGGHDMSSMKGMMSADEMEKLEASRSSEFDQLWAAMMIKHHEGAIGMAEDVQADGENAKVKTVASEIIKAQSSEIEELEKLRDK
ncbi:MAG: DUF305 domain-containing protein [Acidimicrobiales bacterium]|nr:DUF305 domain-containing protein [Acidimicrobiales bacterium]